MNRSTFTTFALAAALAFGGLALASVTASAAAVGHGGKSGGGSPGSPGGGGGGPDDTPLAALVQYQYPCPPTIAAAACNPHKVVRRPVVQVVERCSNWDYPRIILPSGFVVIDYNAEKVRYCGNEPR